MSEREILGDLTEVFREVFDDNSLVIFPTTSAADIAAWDSVNNISLMVATEMRFGVRFKTSELEELKNVEDLVSLINKKLAQKNT
jgi:acyl carrier protein